MCIIAVCVSRKLTPTEIRNCAEVNSDGAGIAWRERDKNHFRKGFMYVEEFEEFYKNFSVLPHIVHFRIATSGGVTEEMCHPYIVSLESPLRTKWDGSNPLLFHNGVIHDWRNTFLQFLPEVARERRKRAGSRHRSKILSGCWSDTRAAAVMVALLGDEVLSFLEGKFALLDKNGHIRMWGGFEKVEGVYFSNDSYKVPPVIETWGKSESYSYTWTPKYTTPIKGKRC